jgi:chitin disaccharide deacetylase
MPIFVGNLNHRQNDHGSIKPAKTICIAIDDFGLHTGVNEASLTLALLGRVSALGCMVGAPAWRKGSELLTGSKLPNIDIGLHLDFTEHPLRPNSRSSLMMLIAKCYTGRVNPIEVREEIRAQLDAFEDVLNRQPFYIDGHQHIHQLPQISNVLMDELIRRYPLDSIWLRSTRGLPIKPPPGLVTFGETFKSRVIFGLGGKAFVKRLERAGYCYNRNLVGIYGFTDSPSRYRALMRFWLESAQPGTLLMCHPSSQANTIDGIGAARLAEYAYLNSDEFSSDLREMGCEVAKLSMPF